MWPPADPATGVKTWKASITKRLKSFLVVQHGDGEYEEAPTDLYLAWVAMKELVEAGDESITASDAADTMARQVTAAQLEILGKAAIVPKKKRRSPSDSRQLTLNKKQEKFEDVYILERPGKFTEGPGDTTPMSAAANTGPQDSAPESFGGETESSSSSASPSAAEEEEKAYWVRGLPEGGGVILRLGST